ncbi:hypothetical protein BP6252_09688 [Coleophoma cylindrospora]|uniref:Uncharacterized protein n=1 Tax=Coleophoma cylindrospora TaxID=1849047 RepID=A0A3D8QW45_9HELO|nr:hypothetical protein BP6252_09688 [Coleophoma cylindrospora]
MASRAREDCYSNERSYEQHVEEHEEHPNHLASAALQTTREQHADDRVQHCSSEDTLNGAIGGRCAPCEPDDLDESEGEENEGYGRGEELEHAEEVLEYSGEFPPTTYTGIWGLLGLSEHDAARAQYTWFLYLDSNK